MCKASAKTAALPSRIMRTGHARHVFSYVTTTFSSAAHSCELHDCVRSRSRKPAETWQPNLTSAGRLRSLRANGSSTQKSEHDSRSAVSQGSQLMGRRTMDPRGGSVKCSSNSPLARDEPPLYMACRARLSGTKMFTFARATCSASVRLTLGAPGPGLASPAQGRAGLSRWPPGSDLRSRRSLHTASLSA